MTELTITLEDGVADWALAEADRRNTTFSQLVGELLAEKCGTMTGTSRR